MPARSLRDLCASLAVLSLCASAFAQDVHPSNNAPMHPGMAAAPSVKSYVEPPTPEGTETILTEPTKVFAQGTCNPGCNSCCNRHCGVYVRAEAIFLDRNTPDVLITQSDSSSGLPAFGAVISGEDLNFDMQSGARLTVGFQVDERNAFEATFTGFLDWNSRATYTDPNENIHFLRLNDSSFPIGADDFLDAYQQTASYSSTLNMVEANHVRRLGQNGAVLAGVRYIDLEEDFVLRSFDEQFAGSDVGRYEVKTRNFMVGPQVGGSYSWMVSDKFSIDASGKAGLLGNFFDVGVKVRNDDRRVYSGQENEVSLASVIDLGATMRYRINRHLTVTGGYQVLMINGAALAIDQAPDTTDTGDIVYHGPNVGLEWRR